MAGMEQQSDLSSVPLWRRLVAALLAFVASASVIRILVGELWFFQMVELAKQNTSIQPGHFVSFAETVLFGIACGLSIAGYLRLGGQISPRFLLSTWFVLAAILCWALSCRPLLILPADDFDPFSDYKEVSLNSRVLWPALALLVFITWKAARSVPPHPVKAAA